MFFGKSDTLSCSQISCFTILKQLIKIFVDEGPTEVTTTDNNLRQLTHFQTDIYVNTVILLVDVSI